MAKKRFRRRVQIHSVLCLALGESFLSGCASYRARSLLKHDMECANQAQKLESDWRRDNGSDFSILTFRDHYNRSDHHCYVSVLYGNDSFSMEALYDAVQGVNKPVQINVAGKDAAPADGARTRELMEDPDDTR